MIKLQFLNHPEMYLVQFSIYSDNIVACRGDFPALDDGFQLFREDGDFLGDFSDYTTIYRKSENEVLFSNDSSISTHYTDVYAFWDDEGDREMFRPAQITVSVSKNGEPLEDIVLSAENGWNKEYALTYDESISVTFPEIAEYTVSPSNTHAIYTHVCVPLPPVEPEPTLEERITDLEETVAEILYGGDDV